MILSGASLTFKHDILKHFLCNTPVKSPTTLYVALFNGDPVNSGGIEVTGSGYARQQITFSEPSNGATDNTNEIEFGPAQADWGTVTHTVIYDSATGGTPLLYGELSRQREILQDDSFMFLRGKYKVSIQDEQGV
jgi:hypothetical protein